MALREPQIHDTLQNDLDFGAPDQYSGPAMLLKNPPTGEVLGVLPISEEHLAEYEIWEDRIDKEADWLKKIVPGSPISNEEAATIDYLKGFVNRACDETEPDFQFNKREQLLMMLIKEALGEFQPWLGREQIILHLFQFIKGMRDSR